MNEISNKGLVFLILLTLSISVVSTLTSHQRIANIQERVGIIQATGFAIDSQSGTASINLSSSVAIALNTADLDWGNGIVNQTTGACSTFSVTTNETGGTSTLNPNNCWTNASGASGAIVEQNDFAIENIGTTNVRLDVNATNSTTFLGFGTAANTGFGWHADESDEPGTCAGTLNTSTWASFDDESTYATVCDDMQWDAGNDLIDVLINISWTRGVETTGARTATVYFRAENST